MTPSHCASPQKHGSKSDVDASVLKDARRLELQEEQKGDVSGLALACVSSLDPRPGAHGAAASSFCRFTGRAPAFEDSRDGLFSLLERHCGDGLDVVVRACLAVSTAPGSNHIYTSTRRRYKSAARRTCGRRSAS